jgi:hypothetical protein
MSRHRLKFGSRVCDIFGPRRYGTVTFVLSDRVQVCWDGSIHTMRFLNEVEWLPPWRDTLGAIVLPPSDQSNGAGEAAISVAQAE